MTSLAHDYDVITGPEMFGNYMFEIRSAENGRVHRTGRGYKTQRAALSAGIAARRKMRNRTPK